MNDIIYEFDSEVLYRRLKPKMYIAVLSPLFSDNRLKYAGIKIVNLAERKK